VIVFSTRFVIMYGFDLMNLMKDFICLKTVKCYLLFTKYSGYTKIFNFIMVFQETAW